MDIVRGRRSYLLGGALILGALALSSCTRAPTDDRLFAARWVAKSVEYEAAALQAFQWARTQLATAILDGWTSAVIEQSQAQAGLPVAVIVDIDETVLSNANHLRDLAERGDEFDEVLWARWVSETGMSAVPGAAEFARESERLGVTVWYVTNRHTRLDQLTADALRRNGFPLHFGADSILSVGKRPEWGSDKSSRRLHVAERYRVALLVGDDIGDFLPSNRPTRVDPTRMDEDLRDRWGKTWIVIPNPIYGSWQRQFNR